jgi:hypothetical protein
MIRRALYAVIALAIVFFGGAYLLPRTVTVTRSIEVAAPPAKVFAIVNSFKRFNEWSPWAGRDPNAKYEVTGPDAGVGSKMSWTGNREVGTGTQEIIESQTDKGVKVKLDFGDMGGGTAAFLLEPAGTGTKVTWGFEGEMGDNPINRWMGLMMDRWIGKDYEEGLGRLKALAEKG